MIFWIFTLRAELSYEEIGHLGKDALVGKQRPDAASGKRMLSAPY